MNDEQKPDPPTEFELAVVQVCYKYMQHAAGNEVALATYAKMQVVAGETLRSVLARSPILFKSVTMDDWNQEDMLDLARRANKADEAKGPQE